MRIFDDDRQEWVGLEQEQRIAELHDRDAVRQGKALRGAVTVLAVGGLAFGAWALGWKDEPRPTGYLTVVEGAPRSTDADADGGTDGGDMDAEGGDTAAPSPEGVPPAPYEEVSDQEGYRLAVPRGWIRDAVTGQDSTVVNYRSPKGDRRLQVYRVAESSPYASLRLWLDAEGKPGGFDQLGPVERTDDGGRPAARLDYTADRFKGEPDIGTWHVVDHRFQAVDGELYALAVYGSDADGRDDEEDFMATALSWFCPPDEICPEPGTH
ncbi:hypothetical protein ABZ916_02950 [Streptomyces sp. NPDC046853]|uniref:hypothetical protein n=1 Tax=Streptomyces sp. NPDC046853 TaxID=3154920 RepID=UPI003404A635